MRAIDNFVERDLAIQLLPHSFFSVELMDTECSKSVVTESMASSRFAADRSLIVVAPSLAPIEGSPLAFLAAWSLALAAFALLSLTLA